MKSRLGCFLAFIILLSAALSVIPSHHPAHAQDESGPYAFGVEWSPDGKWIAVPSNDGLWMFNAEIVERAPTQYFAGHFIPVIAFDPIRDRMAVYDEDARLIHIIEPATGEVIVDIEGATEPYDFAYALAYSNDGKLLAIGYGSSFKIYDAITNRERQVYDSSGVSAITSGLEPGTMLVGTFNGGIPSYNIHEDTFPVSSFAPDDLTLYETIFTLRMLPDSTDGIALRGTGLVKFNLAEETSSLLDPELQELVRGFEMNHATDTLAIGKDGWLIFYDLPSASMTQQIAVPNAEDQVLFSFSFSPDDTQLVTLETTGTIQIWDVAEGRVTVTWYNNFTHAYSTKWG